MKYSENNEWAIITKNLVKVYNKNIVAVDSVDLAIPKNTVYALLGPNGAGKTTTISILTTLINSTSGNASVAGFDVRTKPAEVRRRIGVTFQEMVLDEELTGKQVLDYHGQLYGQGRSARKNKINELLALVELEDAANRRCSTYSGGMKRRLELARGLMTNPEVLFLDEPTLGLDPQNKAGIWEYIKRLKEETGLTLLLTTHQMEEAEQMADIVGIMDHGQIKVEGSPGKLIEGMGNDTIRVTGQGNIQLLTQQLEKADFVQMVISGNGLLQIGVDSSSKRIVDVVSIASKSNFTITDIAMAKPSLGDVFLKYTGRELRGK